MKTRIISNAEIKALLGISGSSKDAIVNMWNGIATETLCELLQVSEIARHTVTDERVKMIKSDSLVLREFPVDVSETITLKDSLNATITGFSFDMDPSDRRTVRLVDSNSYPKSLDYKEVLASYTAGYTVQGTVEVLSIVDLANKTIAVTVAGTETEWTFVASGASGNEINIGVDADATAVNIATALGGTSSGAVVTLPLGTIVALTTATAVQMTITDPDTPENLKMVVALMVGGGVVAPQKKGGVKRYQVGNKSVEFRDGNEAAMVRTIIEQYASTFKKVRIHAI